MDPLPPPGCCAGRCPILGSAQWVSHVELPVTLCAPTLHATTFDRVLVAAARQRCTGPRPGLDGAGLRRQDPVPCPRRPRQTSQAGYGRRPRPRLVLAQAEGSRGDELAAFAPVRDTCRRPARGRGHRRCAALPARPRRTTCLRSRATSRRCAPPWPGCPGLPLPGCASATSDMAGSNPARSRGSTCTGRRPHRGPWSPTAAAGRAREATLRPYGPGPPVSSTQPLTSGAARVRPHSTIDRTATCQVLEPPVDANLSRRLVTEAVGTGLLILFGPGSVVAALALGDGDLDYAALGIIGLSFGLVVALVIYAFGSTSGAHINPAVTVALAATRRFPWREVGPYVAAQLVGAVLGGLLVVAAFGTASVDVSNVGAVSFGPGVGYPRAILVEVLGTFLLMLTIMALAVDKRAPAGWAGLLIGLSVTCVIVVFGPLTGAAINPARAFGPYAASALVGGDVPWSQLPAYVVGSVLGAFVAAISYDLLARPRAAEAFAGGEPPQGTQGDIVGRRAGERGDEPVAAASGAAGRRRGRGGPPR